MPASRCDQAYLEGGGPAALQIEEQAPGCRRLTAMQRCWNLWSEICGFLKAVQSHPGGHLKRPRTSCSRIRSSSRPRCGMDSSRSSRTSKLKNPTRAAQDCFAAFFDACAEGRLLARGKLRGAKLREAMRLQVREAYGTSANLMRPWARTEPHMVQSASSAAEREAASAAASGVVSGGCITPNMRRW